MGTIPNEHGEGFHQDISQTEKRYGGTWSPKMLGDYCWSLIRETPAGEYNRKKEDRVRF
jgi:hypothetical protein